MKMRMNIKVIQIPTLIHSDSPTQSHSSFKAVRVAVRAGK
jgi:hypothetical protein